MNKKALLAAVATLSLASYAAPAHAQIAMVCPLCAQESTTLLQWGKQLTSMATTIQNQYSQLAALKSMFYSNGFGSLSQLQQLGSMQALTNGQLSGVIDRLQSGQFPVGQYSTLQGELQQSNSAVASQLTALQSLLNQQNQQYGNDASAVQSAQEQAATTVGTHQAMMVSNEFQGQMASSLLKIQQLNAATAQTIATQAAVQNEREAAADAFMRQSTVDPTTISTTGGSSY